MVKNRLRVHGPRAFLVLLVACFAPTASAGAAMSLSATANAVGAGTPGLAQPTMVTLTTTVDNNGASPPVPAGRTEKLTQTLPAELANELAKFGACPESKFDDNRTAPGGAEDPSVACPADSLVGNGSLQNYSEVSSPPIAPSDKVVIVKNATTGGLSFWLSFEPVSGLRSSPIIPGTVATNAFGQTVITWDTTPVQPLSAIKLLKFRTSYNANQATLQALEPFANSGCASGSWAFSAVGSFVGGKPANRTAATSLDCTALTPPIPVVPGVVSIRSSNVRVNAQGKGKFALACSSAGPCKGKFEIRPAKRRNPTPARRKVVIAKGSYSLAAGESAKVGFALSGDGAALLERRGGSSGAKLKLRPSAGGLVTGPLTLG